MLKMASILVEDRRDQYHRDEQIVRFFLGRLDARKCKFPEVLKAFRQSNSLIASGASHKRDSELQYKRSARSQLELEVRRLFLRFSF